MDHFEAWWFIKNLKSDDIVNPTWYGDFLKSSTWDPKHIFGHVESTFQHFDVFQFLKMSSHNQKLVDITNISHLCIQIHLLCMTICIVCPWENFNKRWRWFVYIIPRLRDTTLSSNVFLDYLYFSGFPDYDLHSKLNNMLIYKTVTINMHHYAFMMKTYPESYLGLPSFWDKDPVGNVVRRKSCQLGIKVKTYHLLDFPNSLTLLQRS